MRARLRPVAREVRIAVVHAQHGRDEAQDRVLLVVAFAIGQHDVPEAFDHLHTVVIGHGVLDGAGEADGIGGLFLQPFGLAAQLGDLERRQVVAMRQHGVDAVDLDAFVVAVGAGDAHQKRGKRQARVVEGQRFGFGGRQAAQEITNHGERYRTARADGKDGGGCGACGPRSGQREAVPGLRAGAVRNGTLGTPSRSSRRAAAKMRS
jgi:hypothetical protein